MLFYELLHNINQIIIIVKVQIINLMLNKFFYQNYNG